MLKRIVFTSVSLVLALGGIFVLSCTKLQQGVRPSNVPPQIFFVNIPLDESIYSANPTLYWYGTDADGFIVAYQYVVAESTIVNNDLVGFKNFLKTIPIMNEPFEDKDSNGVWDPGESYTEVVKDGRYTRGWVDSLNHLDQRLNAVQRDSTSESMTRDNVFLFASLDTSVYIKQYFFVRSVDNLLSTSDIIFRTYSRNNHPPNTRISYSFNAAKVYYSLPETTETWKGNFIAWNGSDSTDYPRFQPDFEYSWELFGPMDDNTKNALDSATIYSPQGPPGLVDSSFNIQTGSRWVNYKLLQLKNGLETGWYLFRVRCRDDAFVPDSTPDFVIFKVVKPTFENDLLVVDNTNYSPSRPSIGSQRDSLKVRAYYKEIFNVPTIFDNGVALNPPKSVLKEDVISKYKLVVIFEEDAFEPGNGSQDPFFEQIRKYLEVGGMVWLIGNNSFGFSGSRLEYTEEPFLVKAPNAMKCAVDYFGVEKVFFPFYLPAKGGPGCDTLPLDSLNGRNEEFIAADPLKSGWPTLEGDTVRIKDITQVRFGSCYGFYDKIPGVTYIVLRADYFPILEPLYLFRSYWGKNSKLNGKVVAYRYTGSTYVTSEFGFPFSLMKKDQIQPVVDEMLNWFYSNRRLPPQF